MKVHSVPEWPPSPFQWLNEEKIIQRLVELIHPSQDEDVSMALTQPAFVQEGPLARAVGEPSAAL